MIKYFFNLVTASKHKIKKKGKNSFSSKNSFIFDMKKIQNILHLVTKITSLFIFII